MTTAPPSDRPASTSATQPANLRSVATSADSVRLTWGPPTNAIACTIRRSLNGEVYATLQVLPVGAWQYIDTSSGLLAQRPKYQLACGGDPKSLPPWVSFPIPIWKP